GGEGDMGNVLDIARESHTDFPYIPGSSLRGSLRREVQTLDSSAADTLFGKVLADNGKMGVHQVWFGDARLLWVPMRSLSLNGNKNVFTWVSCHSLLRDHAIVSRGDSIAFPDEPVGDSPGDYSVADTRIRVSQLSDSMRAALSGNTTQWADALTKTVLPNWKNNRIVLSDADFQVLMEHSLWTQIRNKIHESEGADDISGGADIFWTDICIPRDTIFYFPWGYQLLKSPSVSLSDHDTLQTVLSGLIQVGGQANVGRGWMQSWVNDTAFTPVQTELVEA
ncbi:MAG: RAMP superfamily CRISPR-associated protein, partial [Cyanobacteria bacterium J06555_13]